MGSPEEFNVLVEIPEGSANKYEYDEDSGSLVLNFVFRDGLHFPFNYGFVPHTKSEDGDPLDAMILSSFPIQPNTVVSVKPIGILRLKDRGKQDNKLVTVPAHDPLVEKLKSITDLGDKEKDGMVSFYKEVGVQKNKTMDIEGFFGKNEAIAEVKRSAL